MYRDLNNPNSIIANLSFSKLTLYSSTGSVLLISSIRALLIDLDNTLMLFNEDEFLTNYGALAAPYFSDLLDESSFFQKLLASTLKMLKNDGTVTNLEAFTQFFITDLPELTFDQCVQRFKQFYSESFHHLSRIIHPVSYARTLLKQVIKANIQVVIATNPIFPKVASVQRLKWAKINDLKIALITHAENMRYCKPHPEYYQDILTKLSLQPEVCLMAGNDLVSDMAASTLGIQTFLVNLDQEKGRLGILSKQLRRYKEGVDPSKFSIDGQGSLKDLEHFIFNQ